MNLIKFLNNLIKYDGFILIDSNQSKYVIGKPLKEDPIKLKLLDKNLSYKLLISCKLVSHKSLISPPAHPRRGHMADGRHFRTTGSGHPR